MSYLDRIAECNQVSLERYTPLTLQDQVLGLIRNDRVERLLTACPSLLRRGKELELLEANTAAFSEQFDALVSSLVREGALRRTGERYGAPPWTSGKPTVTLDRGATLWLGVVAPGVHVNGFVNTPGGMKMWIAKRASHLFAWPNRLDQLIAGGIPFGATPLLTLMKEGEEEAAVPKVITQSALAVSTVTYVHEDSAGLRRGLLHCFDLELPEAFKPSPVDGEVASFELLPIEEVAEIAATTQRFKPNCNLVLIDFLLRHRLLADESGRIADALRVSLDPRR